MFLRPRLPTGPHWGSSPDLLAGLVPLLGRQRKGKIRKGSGGKKGEAMDKRGIGRKRVSWVYCP